MLKPTVFLPNGPFFLVKYFPYFHARDRAATPLLPAAVEDLGILDGMLRACCLVPSL